MARKNSSKTAAPTILDTTSDIEVTESVEVAEVTETPQVDTFEPIQVPEVPTEVVLGTPRRVTLNRVLKALVGNGMPEVKLVWHRTHFTFAGDTVSNADPITNKVDVPRIGDLTELQWVAEAHRVVEASKLAGEQKVATAA